METIERHESGLVIVKNNKSTFFVMDEKTETVFASVPTLRRAKNEFKRTLTCQGF